MLIGVFHARNPLTALSKNRLATLVEEARLQQVDLIFFNDEGIDPVRKQVSGKIPARHGWMPAVRPYPDAVINDLPGDKNLRSERELAMRYEIPFTTARLYGKMFFARQLLQSPVLSPFIVPTWPLTAIDDMDERFKRFDRLVIKPDSGRKGRGIYLLFRQHGRYVWQHGNHTEICDRAGLIGKIRDLTERQSFLVQPYIRCLTDANEPFDFRVLAQRDDRGQWAISRIYPRIGIPGTVTSNVAQGGRVEELAPFVGRAFPERPPELIIDSLYKVGLAFVEEISTLFAFPINELGLDLAIDDEGRMWFYEANASPATKYDHRARAVRTIGYARYLAEAYRPQYDEPVGAVRTIGLLVKDKPSAAFLTACSNAATAHGARMVYFSSQDIRAEGRVIHGYVRDHAQWTQTEMACPPVICDLLQQRTNPDYSAVYRQLSRAAFTSETSELPVPVDSFWQSAAMNAALREAIPECGYADRTLIDRHPAILLKSKHAGETDKTMLIRHRDGGYRLSEWQHTHHLTPSDLDILLPMLRSKGFYALQWLDSATKSGHAFLLRVFLMKAGHRVWETAAKMPLIALNPAKPCSNRPDELPPLSNYIVFVQDEFGQANMVRIDSAIDALCANAVDLLDKLATKRFNQVCFDFAVSADGRVWLQDVHGRWPLSLFHHPAVARMTVAHALSLASAEQPAEGLSL